MPRLARLATAVTAFAPAALAQAISCYTESGCPQCETEDSMYAARQDFCSSNDWSHSSYLNRGFAHITLDGAFDFAPAEEARGGFGTERGERRGVAEEPCAEGGEGRSAEGREMQR